jgi:circadian clock protein KaiC
MGLLAEAERRRELLTKLTKEKKKYIDHVDKKRKNVIHAEIKKQRKLIGKQNKFKKIAPKVKSKLIKPQHHELKPLAKKPSIPIITKNKVLLPEVPKVVEKKEEKKKKTPVKKKEPKLTKEKKVIIPKEVAPAFDLGAIKKSIEQELGSAKEESKVDSNKPKIDSKEFIFTGIPGFDALLDNGIPRGSSILLAGGAGSGKTIMALQVLYSHALKGDKCLYMSFEESEERLVRHMSQFGWDAQKLIQKGNLFIQRLNPFEITRSVDALLMKAKGELMIDVNPVIFPNHFKPTIVVVDSLSAIASAFTGKEDSYRIYIEQLFRLFEEMGATSLLITETQQVPTVFSATGVEEFLADGVVVIYNIKRGNIRERAIEILKLRGAGHKKKIVAMSIGSKGIEVFPEQEVFGGVEGNNS